MEIFRHIQGLFPALHKALPNGARNVDPRLHAVGAGPVAVVRLPVGKAAHGAVNAGAVHAETLHMVIHQFGGVFLVARVVIIHGNAVPLVVQGAVPSLGTPVRVFLGQGVFWARAVRYIIEQYRHTQFMGFVYVIFCGPIATVPGIDDRLIGGMVYVFFPMVEDGKQPHMVNPHVF